MKRFLTLTTALLLLATLNAQTYLTESFDNETFPPTGWTHLDISGDNKLWDRQTSGTNPNCSPNSGAAMIRYNSYSYSAGSSAALISSVVDLSSATTPIVEFWMYRDNAFPSLADRVEILINTTPAFAGATHLGTINRTRSLAPTETADGWYKYVLAIPAGFNSATNYILIRGISAYGNNIFVDDVTVRESAPAPNAPTSFSVSNQTISSLQVNWVDNSTNETTFRIYMATSPGGPYSLVGTVPSTTTANTGDPYSYTVTGLLDNTTYHFRIAAVYEIESTYLYGTGATLAGTISGDKTIGPSGDYPTLTAAFDAINTNGLASHVNLILQSNYDASAETFPIVPSPIGQANKTITIYPAVAGLSITSNNTTATFNLNGSKYIIIDGRVNATGTDADLVISNTSTSGVAIQFINDAANNTIQFCKIRGVYAATTIAKGVIFFSTTTGTFGNSNNIIRYNKITSGSTLSNSLIYSSGTASAPNENNLIQENEIYDYFHPSAISSGIYLSSASNSWGIRENSFYQTASRSTTSAVYAVYISNTLGGNFHIFGNYIGGSQPMCGGTPMTYTNASPFLPIFLSAGTTFKSAIEGNIIKNISLTAAGTSTSFGTIRVLNGKYDIKNNTIGDLNSSNSINITMSGSGAYFSAIATGTGATGNDEVLIEGNTIAGISFATSGSPTTIPHFRGISVQSGGPTANHTIAVRNNQIKNVTYNANSTFFGILSFGGSSTQIIDVEISGNTVENIVNSNTGTNAAITAFHIQGSGTNPYYGRHNVINNTVIDITNSGGGATRGMIHFCNSNGGLNIEGNTFRNISNVHSTANVAVQALIGMFPTMGVNKIHRNYISGLNAVSTGTTAIIEGLNIQTGTYFVENNMIALGNEVTNGIQINGINQFLGSGVKIYHNSVYIGGTVTSGTAKTYAFNRNQTSAAADVINNIFVNERTGDGLHYAMKISSATDYTSGWLVSDYNVLKNANASNLMAVGTDDLDFATWKATTGFDANSLNTDPLFVNPTSTIPNLHLTMGSPAEGAGLEIPSVTYDFDGDIRANMTPVDIGADAGDYDNIPPTIISFNPPNGATDVAVGINIVVTFSENVRKVDDSPIDESVVTFKKVSDNSDVPFTVNYANKVLTILPNSALNGFTGYSITIAGVEDLSNNPLTGVTSATFTTGTSDFTPPYIVNANINNSNPSALVVNFNENVKLTNTNGITVTVNGVTRNITGYLGSGTDVLTFNLETPVQSHDEVLFSYDATIGNIADISNNPLASVTDLVVINNVLSDEKDILSFVIAAADNAAAGVTADIVGTISANTVEFYVNSSVDLTALVPTIIISNWATINPASGVAQNFTSPVPYIVTAEDGSTKTYTVTARVIYNLPFLESFNGPTLPAGWTQINSAGVTSRWSVSNTSYAGGSPHEMKCTYQNIIGITRFVTPPINTSGVTQIKLSFRHYLDAYSTGATLKVLSSTDLTNWTEEWAVATTSTNIQATLVNLTINNILGDVTYFAFAVEGNLFNIDYWYIDDVIIRTPSSNSLLSSLTVDGAQIPGFTPNVFNYEYNVPQGAPVPVVGATPADPNAEVSITQATQVPGNAYILVTAENGVAFSEYNVTFFEIPGFNVTFTVKDYSENPIEGAVVTVNGQNFTTGTNGTVTVLLGAGTYNYTVSASSFVTYNGSVVVVDQNLQITVQLQDQIEDPFGLLVEVNGNNATFSWNNLPFSFNDDFESYPNFAVDNFGPYTFVDVDQRNTYVISNTTWPNAAYTGVAIIWNPSATTPPYNNPGWQPRNGQKCVAIFDAVPGGGITANNDWIISQQLLAQSGLTFSFWAKSATSQYGLERIRVLVSTTGTQPSDFIPISAGNYLEVPVTYTQYSYDLSTYAGMNIYVAIQCVSADAFALLIDDLSITINKKNESKAFLGYNVFLNGTQVASNVSGTSYEFTNLPAGTHTAGVQAVYSSGTSQIVTTEFTIQPSAYPVTFTVVDNQGSPLSGALVSVGGLQAETNTSGVAVIELGNGDYSYTVTKLGYVTVTDNVLVNFSPVNVNVTMQPAQFTVTFVVRNASTNAAVSAATVVINPGNLVSLTNASGTASRNLYNGNYTYTVTKTGFVTYDGSFTINNANLTINVNLEPVVGIDAVEGLVRVYPNPVSDFITIERNSTQDVVVELYNVSGSVVNTFTTTDATLSLDVTNLPSGTYYIRMISESGTTVHRIVKE